MHFEQVRKRIPQTPNHKCELIVACPVMKTNNNVSMIARSASCFGATLIITGKNKVVPHISRDCNCVIKHHNSLLPVVKHHKQNGYKIIGMEQVTNSQNLMDYKFELCPTMIVIGNECKGMGQEILDILDEVIEIPLFGPPHSLNVAVATSLCLYEFAKQLM